MISCGLLQTKPPTAGFESFSKINACSLGAVRRAAAKFPGKL